MHKARCGIGEVPYCFSRTSVKLQGQTAQNRQFNYSDVIMSAMGSHVTGISIVYSTACSGVDQRKHQSSDSLVFLRGIHQ